MRIPLPILSSISFLRVSPAPLSAIYISSRRRYSRENNRKRTYCFEIYQGRTESRKYNLAEGSDGNWDVLDFLFTSFARELRLATIKIDFRIYWMYRADWSRRMLYLAHRKIIISLIISDVFLIAARERFRYEITFLI